MPSIGSNKTLIRDFYRRCVANGDLEFAHQIIADDYIQHSPSVKPGKTGLLEALTYLKQMPKPATPAQPFMRLIAEGDFVVTNMAFEMGGQSKVVVDLFRLHNGQIAEHWDAMEDEPATTQNGHPMMDGPVEIDDFDRTAAHKKAVTGFFQQVLINRNLDRLPDYVALDLIQHSPDIANGLVGLKQYLQTPKNGFTVQNVLRIIGEGNFVAVQSEGLSGGKPATFYDIFRLRNGKISEHWRVKQLAG